MTSIGEYTLRPARETDVPALLDIYDYEVQNGVATFDYETPSLAERIQWFRTEFGPTYPLTVAADKTDKAVGYCGIQRFNSKKGYDRTVVITLYIHRDHFRKGLGLALSKDIIAKARELGHRNIIAMIAAENKSSMTLFERLGFKTNGLFPALGFKFGRDLDVAYSQLTL
ncbi:Phosphinothricin acetyltransferase [Geranomyces variabilis]|nr:Phosphinothricin acetyltransferase [Geranomyces variabilis]KAJ3140298.1 hypothetical protein HDU90_008526 [Geranomyces variabilis]